MNETVPPQLRKRRNFIKTVATVAGMTIAPGILFYGFSQVKAATKTTEPSVTAKVRWGMLIDTSQCSEECSVCVNACKTEHGLTEPVRSEIAPQWIRKVGLRDPQTGKHYSLPILCQHCETPPCVDVCPTGASFKRADGIILVDRHICIGCRYCMMACPFKARSLVHIALDQQKTHTPRGQGTVEGCNFCVYRIDHGQLPACVEACQQSGHQAMLFGDLKDHNSGIAKKLSQVQSTVLRPDMRLTQGVHYQGI